MALTITVSRHKDVTIFDCDGRVTLGEGSVQLRNAVRESLWNGQRKLALDYGDVFYQDSSGLGELLSAFTSVKNLGGELVFFGITAKFRDLLTLTKFLRVFEIFDTREAALNYFDSSRDQTFKVETNSHAQVTVLDVQGYLTHGSNISSLDTAIAAASEAAANSLIALCTQLLEIDETGACALVRSMRRVRETGGDLVLAGIERRLVPEVDKIRALDEIERFETIDLALKKFGLAMNRETWRIERIYEVKPRPSRTP